MDGFCKRNLVFGARVQLPWCVDILDTPKKSQRTSMFDDIMHFVDVRVGIVSSHFVLRKFVLFLKSSHIAWNAEIFGKLSRILQPLLVSSGFSSWLRMNMSWRWMWCVWDRWKVLWKWDISLMLGGKWDVDRMNNCGCQCLLSCWMWRLYLIIFV